MKIKEFAHKNGLVFFYTTIILLIILIIVFISGFNNKPRFDRVNREGFNRFENKEGMMKYKEGRMNQGQDQGFNENEEILPSLDNQ